MKPVFHVLAFKLWRIRKHTRHFGYCISGIQLIKGFNAGADHSFFHSLPLNRSGNGRLYFDADFALHHTILKFLPIGLKHSNSQHDQDEQNNF